MKKVRFIAESIEKLNKKQKNNKTCFDGNFDGLS